MGAERVRLYRLLVDQIKLRILIISLKAVGGLGKSGCVDTNDPIFPLQTLPGMWP